MSSHLRNASFLAAALALVLPAAASAQSVAGSLYSGKPEAFHNEARAEPPGRAIDSNLPAEFHLQPLTATEAADTGAKPGLVRVGVRRDLPDTWASTATLTPLPDGRRSWRAALASPGASAVRLHIRDFDAAGGELWIYTSARSEGPFTAPGPFGDGEFWTGEFEGSSVTIEFVEAAPGAQTRWPPFRVASLVHLWTGATPRSEAPRLTALPEPRPGASSAPPPAELTYSPREVAFCHLDVSCYAPQQNAASAIAQLTFAGDDGGSYVCSGAMINTRNSSFRPYLLTAHHCISSAAEARSVIARFRYQTSSCGGAPPGFDSVPAVTGGTYLGGGPFAEGDYSLLLLGGAPPAGTFFLGWDPSVNALALGDPATGIHHPDGSWKRISFGSRVGDANVSVGGESAPGERYFRIAWNEGKTEGGSSGSPLLNSSGQIVGMLSYGPIVPPGLTVCDVNPEVAGYGRFSNAYATLREYLEDAPPPSLTVSPSTVSFTVVNGQYTGPSQQTLTIRTQSAGTVNFNVAASASWIRLSATSGTVTAASAATITVSMDPSQFPRTTVTSGTVSVSSGSLTPLRVLVEANVAVSRSMVSMAIQPNPVLEQPPDEDGFAWFFDVVLTESAGVATRVTSFRIDGIDYSANIADWFGSNTLPAGGRLTASLRSRGTVTNRAFSAAGADAVSGQTWSAAITVPFLGRPTSGVLTMESAPAVIRQNPSSSNCPWYQVLVLRETGGFAVTLTAFTAGGSSLTSTLADYWGTTRLPANGTLRAGICWTGVQTPTSFPITVTGTDSNGRSLSASATGVFAGPAANSTTMATSSPSVFLSAPAGYSAAVTATFDLTLGSSSAPWTGRLLFPDGANSAWLTVSPLSGSGSAALRLTAPPGARAGSREATLLIQSVDAVPQLLLIPIRLVVGAAGGGPFIDPAGIVSNASYRQIAAPGAILSVFGQRLAQGVLAASALPLPVSMQGTTAFVNGRPAPLYYVSPGLVNLQIPFETEIGIAVLTITVNGLSASQEFLVSSTAPGIYTTVSGAVVPVSEAARGDFGVLFITGQGRLSPALATGAAPSPSTPLSGLPVPVASISITVGGVPATVAFAGNPYAVAGVIQINYQLSPLTPTGVQPVVVRAGDRLSAPAFLLVR